MPQRIHEDHKYFLDVYAGRVRKELGRYINNGKMFRERGKNGKIAMTVPKIDVPYIVHGRRNSGVGRGEGDPGDVIDRDDPQGRGRQAGDGHQDGVTILIDQDEILKLLKDDLKLPDMQPKPNQTYEEIETRYTNVSKKGPESLRHNRRTFKQALKRQLASGDYDKEYIVPGYDEPLKLITPINEDKRYRQWKEIKKPASNAVIFFARDGSASMDQEKCDIVSDMAWWIDLWIRTFYRRVERCYIWHDAMAQEVDEEKFYNYRYGGGTRCSTALDLVAKQLENRFPPDKWNIYVLYFGDGENWGEDNTKFTNIIKEKFPSNIANLVAVTQVLAYSYEDSLKQFVDDNLVPYVSNVRTAQIGSEDTPDLSGPIARGYYGSSPSLSDEERDRQVRRAIMEILGAKVEEKKKAG